MNRLPHPQPLSLSSEHKHDLCSLLKERGARVGWGCGFLAGVAY